MEITAVTVVAVVVTLGICRAGRGHTKLLRRIRKETPEESRIKRNLWGVDLDEMIDFQSLTFVLEENHVTSDILRRNFWGDLDEMVDFQITLPLTF